MIIRRLTAEEKERYNQVVNHPLQSWEWGEFRASLGKRVERLGVFDQGKLKKGWQIFFHPLPGTSFTVGYFPKGPLPDKEMVAALRELGEENKAIFIKLEPDFIIRRWRNEKGKVDPSPVEEKEISLSSLGLIASPRPVFDRYSFILNLNQSEERLLAQMHHKTRYNIRLAQRRGIEVEEENSQVGLAIFLRLLFGETLKRQGFYLHNEAYFKKMWQALSSSGMVHLLLAKYKEEALAVWMLFVWKDWLYYPYGASSSRWRQLMASNLVCWEAIRLGKRLGCRWFDMWGGLSPEASPDHPWYGFHRFKLGYGGELVEFVGSWDLVLNPLLYRLYQGADNLRWWFLRGKRKLGQWLSARHRKEV